MREKDDQLTLGLDTRITADEVLRRLGLTGQSAEFAGRINSVAGNLPNEIPIYQLILWNSRLLKRAERRISYRKRDMLRHTREHVSEEMLQAYSEEERKKMRESAALRIEELERPVTLEPAPEPWASFVAGLSETEKTTLFRAIGHFWKDHPMHYTHGGEKSAYFHNLADFRDRSSGFQVLEPGSGSFKRQVKKRGGATSFFLAVSFQKAPEPS